MKPVLIIGAVVVTGVVIYLVVKHIKHTNANTTKTSENKGSGYVGIKPPTPAERQADASFNMTNNFGNPNKPVY